MDLRQQNVRRGVVWAEFHGGFREFQGPREVVVPALAPEPPPVEVIEAEQAVGFGIVRVHFDRAR